MVLSFCSDKDIKKYKNIKEERSISITLSMMKFGAAKYC